MDTYTRKLELIVKVEAFEEDDVEDFLNDFFGPGYYEDGVTVEEMHIVSE